MSKRKHKVVLTVSFFMDEMDGTPEQSAEIAEEIMEILVREHTAWAEQCEVSVRDFYEIIPSR